MRTGGVSKESDTPLSLSRVLQVHVYVCNLPLARSTASSAALVSFLASKDASALARLRAKGPEPLSTRLVCNSADIYENKGYPRMLPDCPLLVTHDSANSAFRLAMMAARLSAACVGTQARRCALLLAGFWGLAKPYSAALNLARAPHSHRLRMQLAGQRSELPSGQSPKPKMLLGEEDSSSHPAPALAQQIRPISFAVLICVTGALLQSVHSSRVGAWGLLMSACGVRCKAPHLLDVLRPSDHTASPCSGWSCCTGALEGPGLHHDGDLGGVV